MIIECRVVQIFQTLIIDRVVLDVKIGLDAKWKQLRWITIHKITVGSEHPEIKMKIKIMQIEIKTIHVYKVVWCDIIM